MGVMNVRADARTDPEKTTLRGRLRDGTAAAILSAAEAVIAEEGLGAARIERIAAQAGVSVGTIYNHFQDRTALVQALFDSRGANLRRMMDEALATSEGQPAAVQVRALLRSVVEHGREHGQLFSALLRENHGPARIRPPDITRLALAECAALVVARGIASGELREDTDRVLPEALTALTRQAFACAVDGRGSEAEVDALAAFFVRGASR